MRLNKKRLILAIIVIVILVIVFVAIGKREIKESDFIHQFDCYEPSVSLVSRCNFWGGELREEVSSIGFGVIYTFGCYPQGKTADEGKECEYNIECEGECIWLEGDFVTENSSSVCSGYKAPYFTLMIAERSKIGNFKLCE